MPVLLPLLELAGGVGVAVEPGPVVGLGQLDPDGVGAVPAGQPGPLVGADDVVGRGDDHGQIDPGGVVAEAGERFESGHGHCVAQAPAALVPIAFQMLSTGRAGVRRLRRSGLARPRPGRLKVDLVGGEPLGMAGGQGVPVGQDRHTRVAGHAGGQARRCRCSHDRGTSTLTNTTRDTPAAACIMASKSDGGHRAVGAQLDHQHVPSVPAARSACTTPIPVSNCRLTSPSTADPGDVGLEVRLRCPT